MMPFCYDLSVSDFDTESYDLYEEELLESSDESNNDDLML